MSSLRDYKDKIKNIRKEAEGEVGDIEYRVTKLDEATPEDRSKKEKLARAIDGLKNVEDDLSGE